MKFKDITNSEFFSLVEIELHDCGSVRFTVKGTSMQPIIRNERDEVRLAELDGLPCVGDICLFKFRGNHILHRLVRIDNDTFIMQGDNVITNHEWCKLQDIVGVVKEIYRDGNAVSPTSTKWRYITVLHRLKLRVRYFLSRIVHRIIK